MSPLGLHRFVGTVRTTVTRGAGVVALLLLVGTTAAVAEARGSVAREASAIAHSLMSPFCPGMTLAACPSPNAADVRTEISQRLRNGESRAAIVADLEARFGDAVASAPRATGFGLLFWIAPAFLGIAVLAAIATALRGDGTADPPPPADQVDAPALVARLDDELGDLD